MKIFLPSLRLLLALTVLTGIVYPLAVWAVGQACYRDRAEGSLVTRGDKLVGSALLAQKTTGEKYFWPRPSAADFATVASGASNLAWTSAKLADGIEQNAKAFRAANHLAPDAPLPADLVTASGSGLDPEISADAARLQIARVAAARGLDAQKISVVVDRAVEAGLFGPPRVNVLRLNLALDTAYP